MARSLSAASQRRRLRTSPLTRPRPLLRMNRSDSRSLAWSAAACSSQGHGSRLSSNSQTTLNLRRAPSRGPLRRMERRWCRHQPATSWNDDQRGTSASSKSRHRRGTRRSRATIRDLRPSTRGRPRPRSSKVRSSPRSGELTRPSSSSPRKSYRTPTRPDHNARRPTTCAVLFSQACVESASVNRRPSVRH